MTEVCKHGRRIEFEWHECPECSEEEFAGRLYEEELDAVHRISSGSEYSSTLDTENRVIRAHLETLTKTC